MFDSFDKFMNKAGRWLAFLLAVASIYVAGPFPLVNEGLRLGGGIAVSVVIMILVNPLAKLGGHKTPQISALLWLVDLVLLVGFIYTIQHFFKTYDSLWDGVFSLSSSKITTGVVGIMILLEAVRRSFGAMLPMVCLTVFFFALWGGDLPGVFGHRGYDLEDTVTAIWFSFDGVFGRVTGLVSSIVLVFIVFGAILEATKASDVLLKFAVAFTARIRGGSAHAAIVSSALFGTISGSSVANVVGTGVFTIPMIKRQGYSAKFAGAVEASASAAGQFTPPIMGAVGFIMAEMIGQPYYIVAVAAIVPAFFYYYCMFASVYAEAVRLGIEPLPPEDRPIIGLTDWVQALRFLVPMIAVVTVLFWGRSPAIAGFAAIIVAIAVAAILDLLSPARKTIFSEYPKRFLDAMKRGGAACAQIMVAVGSIGVVIAVVKLTGIAGNFGALVAQLADGSLFVALIVTMLACLMLGLGLPTVPAYLFIVLFVGPIFTKLGINILLVHMFVLYFGVLSNVTPPVAIAAYAAAPIAKSNPMATSLQAMKIAFVGFLIPFVFVYNPSLTLVVDFNLVDFMWIFIRLTVSVWLIATAFIGCDTRKLSAIERVGRFIIAITMLLDFLAPQLLGFSIGVAIIVLHRLSNRKSKQEA
jgi:TRAP transporter 4TM/12TM fusion protein